MSTFEKAVRRLVAVMYNVAGAAINVMMLITCVDVLLRFMTTIYAKSGWEILASLKPIAGTYELVCLMGVVAASFAMAHTTLQSGHVAVNFVVRLLSQKVQALFQIGTGTLGFFFFAIVCWRSIEYGGKARFLGEVSMTLQIPYYPFIYGVAFSAFTVCLVLIVLVVNELTKVVEK